MVQRSKSNKARKYFGGNKRNPGKPKKDLITITSERKVECCEITLDVDDVVYESIVEAGRIHIQGDKDALFNYAMNRALSEIENIK